MLVTKCDICKKEIKDRYNEAVVVGLGWPATFSFPANLRFVFFGNYVGDTEFLCYSGHTGHDIPANRGEAVLAAADGTIIRIDDKCEDGTGYSQANPNYGNRIDIRHASTGFTTLYGHLKHLSLVNPVTGQQWRVNEPVAKGTQIAEVDSKDLQMYWVAAWVLPRGPWHN